MNPILPYANLAVSWALLVLIWVVQIIIYPSFHCIAPEAFAAYHKWYVKRISSVVVPLMISELGLTAWWILSGKHLTVSLFSSFLVITVWLSTFGLQVPIHNQLQTGKKDVLIQRLVTTNWIRTAAWSLKAGLVSIDSISRTF